MTPPEACRDLRRVALSDDPLAELTRIEDRLTGSGMSLSDGLKRVDSVPLLLCVLRLFGGELTEDVFNPFFLKRKQEALGQESTEMLEFADYAEGQQVIISKMLKELGRSDAAQSLLKEMPPSLAASSCLGDFILSAMNTDLADLPTSAQILNLMKEIEIEVANVIRQQILEASSSTEDTASNSGPPSATSNSNPNRHTNAKPSRNNRHVKTSPQHPQVPANNSQGRTKRQNAGGRQRADRVERPENRVDRQHAAQAYHPVQGRERQGARANQPVQGGNGRGAAQAHQPACGEKRQTAAKRSQPVQGGGT